MDSKGTQPCVYMYPFAPQRGFLGRKGRPRDRQNQEVGNRQELRGPLLSLVSSLRLHSEVETETQTGKCLAEPTGSRAPLGMRRALSVGPRDQRLMLASWYCLWPVSSPTRKPSGLHWLTFLPMHFLQWSGHRNVGVSPRAYQRSMLSVPGAQKL